MIIKSLFQKLKTFGTVYALEIYFVNPFLYNIQIFGCFSFETDKAKGYGLIYLS